MENEANMLKETSEKCMMLSINQFQKNTKWFANSSYEIRKSNFGLCWKSKSHKQCWKLIVSYLFKCNKVTKVKYEYSYEWMKSICGKIEF